MERTSLTFQTFKNTTYNIVGYIWPTLLTLFITPVVIISLGVKDYGIYIFINTILSLLGLLDLGIGTAVSKYMANYYGKKDDRAITTLTHTANSLFLMIGIIGMIVALIISVIGPMILHGQATNYAQYFPLITIAGAIFFVNTIDGSYASVLFAIQRFDVSNTIGIISITASTLGLLITVLLKGSLITIFIVQLVIAAAVSIAIIFYAMKYLPQATFAFGWNKPEIKKCYTFGLVIFINNIANSALSYLDRLIIPFFVGPSSLTYYSIPGNIATKIPGASGTLSGTLFPTTSQLDGANERDRIETLYIRSFRLIIIVASALTITTIALAYQALQYWLGIDFAEHSTNILIILAVTNFILALLGPLSGFLLGLGKVRFITTMSVIMGVLNAILLLILLPSYGITGAAWAYLLSVLPVAYMFYYTETKFLALSHRKQHYAKIASSIFIVSAIVWAIDTFVLSTLIVNLWTLILIGLTSIILFVITYRLFGFFEEEDWRDIEHFRVAITNKILRRV
jgi:O-antigen/teichoic acid export membrane protein